MNGEGNHQHTSLQKDLFQTTKHWQSMQENALKP